MQRALSWVQNGRCLERVVDKLIKFPVKPFCFGHIILLILYFCPIMALFVDN